MTRRITAHKGGRTARAPEARMTPQERGRLDAVLQRRGVKHTDWYIDHVNADYAEITARKENEMPPKNGREVIQTIGDYEIVRVDNTPHRGHVEAWGESEAIKVYLTDDAIRRGLDGVEEIFDSVDEAREWIEQH